MGVAFVVASMALASTASETRAGILWKAASHTLVKHVSTLSRALRQPGLAISVAMAIGRGMFYKVWYHLRGVRFIAGRNFRVFGRLKLNGPGSVVFGDNVMVGMLVTPFTHHVDATITVGNHCFLNGVR